MSLNPTWDVRFVRLFSITLKPTATCDNEVLKRSGDGVIMLSIKFKTIIKGTLTGLNLSKLEICLFLCVQAHDQVLQTQGMCAR